MTIMHALAVVSLACVWGCAEFTPFTKAHRDEFAGSLPDLQFFVSQDTMLSRTMESEERKVSPGHIIKIEKGKRIEQIRLPKNTPGVFVKAESHRPDTLHIAFEPPDSAGPRTLPFAYRKGSDYYYLDCPGGKITYEGKQWDVTSRVKSNRAFLPAMIWSPSASRQKSTTLVSPVPYLLVDLEQVTDVERETRVLPGVRLPKE